MDELRGAVRNEAGLADPEMYRVTFTVRPPEGDASDESLATMWAAEFWTTRQGTVTLALTGAPPGTADPVLLSDMTYRLVVGRGDDPAAARWSVERGAHDQASRT